MKTKIFRHIRYKSKSRTCSVQHHHADRIEIKEVPTERRSDNKTPRLGVKSNHFLLERIDFYSEMTEPSGLKRVSRLIGSAEASSATVGITGSIIRMSDLGKFQFA